MTYVYLGIHIWLRDINLISIEISYHVMSLFMFPIDQYMAFGISGSDVSTNMVGADVVVTWINDDGPNAVDYYLTGRQQVASYRSYIIV